MTVTLLPSVAFASDVVLETSDVVSEDAEGGQAESSDITQPEVDDVPDLEIPTSSEESGTIDSSECDSESASGLEQEVVQDNEDSENPTYVELTASSQLSTNPEASVVDVTLKDSAGNVVTSVVSGTSVTASASEPEGYKFLGWYKDSYSSGAEVLSTKLAYTFGASESMNLIAVYDASGMAEVVIKGNGVTVTYGDTTQEVQNNSTCKIPIGTKVTVTSTSETFIRWINEDRKVLSTEKAYEFVVTGNITIDEVTRDSTSAGAFVEFVSGYNQVICSGTYTVDGIKEDIFPSVPSMSGYTVKGWKMTVEELKKEIEGGKTHIVISPAYEENTTKSKITVYVNDEVSEELSRLEGTGSTLTINAPEVAGKKFAYWTAQNGTILSYEQAYFMLVSGDTSIYAVYKESEETAVKPTIVVTSVSAIDEGAKKLVFTTTRSVPKGYELLEHGVLYGSNAEIANYVLGGSNIKQRVSTDKKVNGVFTLYLNIGGNTSKIAYVRGYMIVKNTATGEQETVYSEIATGSFDSLPKN